MKIIKSMFDNSRKLKELKADFEFLSARYNKLIDMNAKQQADHKSQIEKLESALQMKRRDSAEHVDNLKGLIDELRAESKKLQAELDNRKKLAGIKFTAIVPERGLVRTEFKLGLGSCGLIVDALGWKEEADRYILTQWCAGGERKEFTYFKNDIRGRIELQYNSLKGNTL